MDEVACGRTVQVTPPQLEILISFMEKNLEFAVFKDNLLPIKRKVIWRNLQLELNSVIGGAIKSLEQWRRTWQDQLKKSRKKALNLIKSGEEGSALNPFEERILKILSVNNLFESPEPSTDVFLIPETGVVFTLPVVSQDGDQLSTSQDKFNSLLPESNSSEFPVESQSFQQAHLKVKQEEDIEGETTQSIDEILRKINQNAETHREFLLKKKIIDIESISKAYDILSGETSQTLNDCLPKTTNLNSTDCNETASNQSFTRSYKAITSSTEVKQGDIKEETSQSIDEILQKITQDAETHAKFQLRKKKKDIQESISKAVNILSGKTSQTLNGGLPKTTNLNSSDCDETTSYPSFTRRYKSITSVTGRKRKMNKVLSDRMVMSADRTVDLFENITETNCAVLEKIAAAMELQTARSTKQTQIMQELLAFVKK